MKLSYTQRKLVLASALLAVLSGNVGGGLKYSVTPDFTHSRYSIQSIDLASSEEVLNEDEEEFELNEDVELEAEPAVTRRTASPQRPVRSEQPATTSSSGSIDSKIYTAEGVLKVQYIRGGNENETLAIVQRRTTEGQSCNDCFDTISLGISNKADIDDLNVALMKSIQSQKAPRSEARVTSETREKISETPAELEELEETEVARKDPFERVIKACERRSDSTAKLSCLTDGMLSILSSRTIKATEYEVNAFFVSELQPLLVGQISEARKLLSNSGTSDQSIFEAQLNREDSREFVRETQLILEKLIAKVPAKYESIRGKILLIQSQVLQFEVAQFHQVNESAKTATDLNQKSTLQIEATNRMNSANLLAQLLISSSSTALNDARTNDIINNDTLSLYQKFLNDFKIEFYKSLSNPAAVSAVLQPGVAGGQTSVNLPANVDFSKRISRPNRGTGVIVNSPVILQQQTPANQAQAQSGVIIPIPIQSTGNSMVTPSDAMSMRLQMQQRQ